jgi:hypothetical protein
MRSTIAASVVGVVAVVALIENLAGKSFSPNPRTAASSPLPVRSGHAAASRLPKIRIALGDMPLAAVAPPLATVMGHMFKA